MTRRVIRGARFVSGRNEDGRLYLVRSDGSQARCAVLMCLGTLTDNDDGTQTLTFGGS